MAGSHLPPHGVRLDQILAGMGMDFTQEKAQEGEIAKTVAKDGDPCFVSVHVGDYIDVIGPCPYMPRGAALPQKGMRCIVITTELGQPWITAWWPYA